METHIPLLRSKYLERKKRNSHYSLTAYARDLGVSISFLSRLLRGQRPLTAKQAIQISAILGLSSRQTDTLIAGSRVSKKTKAAYAGREMTVTDYEVERFKAISEWYHFAILSLTFVDGFEGTAAWTSKRLGISKIEAQDALDRLLNLGLLEKQGSKLIQTQKNIFVETKKSELAVREFQLQMIEKSKSRLQDTSQDAFDDRYMAGSTLAIQRKAIPALRKRLKEFQLEFANAATAQNYSDVYHLNLHFFPISNQRSSKK